MSARIIIEKDGRRWAANDYDIRLTTYSRTASLKGIGVWATDVYLTELPPVIRTDNSEVIARLLSENAELKKTIEDNLRVAKACSESDYDEKASLREDRVRLLQENAKLREALKPVLEVNSDFKIYDAILGLETYKLFALKEAVRKAQEILAHGCASTQKEMDCER